MNENIDLTKILKNCPKGWKFWSSLFGEVEFNKIQYGYINVITKYKNYELFNTDATITIGDVKSEEIMLFPSKDQKDWSKFTAPWYKNERKGKFDPNTLKPFDKVLVRDYCDDEWLAEIFTRYFKDRKYPYVGICLNSYTLCIPYNGDTKHLIGTTEDAPEYYRYWED